MNIRICKPTDQKDWDAYVLNHSDSTHCHLYGWKEIIEKTYGHKGNYLIAEQDSKILGIMPLIHLKSFLFGNHLVSMPFLNYGGILSDSREIEGALMHVALDLCASLKVSCLQLRHLNPINGLHSENENTFIRNTHKVRMLLKLPQSPEALLKSFKSKLRSQIQRPQKEGMAAIIGGMELLEQFYRVFSINMRDLGSPVHSRKLFQHLLSQFDQEVRIGIVRYRDQVVSGGLIFCFRDTVEIPWASSLRQYNRLSPNMLLYWSLLKYACEQRFRYFDFGRSTPGKGTYKFKEQWGAKPHPLIWYIAHFTGYSKDQNTYLDGESPTMTRAVALWQKLPLFVANRIGPIIRSSISL
ncbi:MAG: FemAB family XrtA/PEP-CTERM system-associated protein [Candidatus Hodarchaeota archaeon]